MRRIPALMLGMTWLASDLLAQGSQVPYAGFSGQAFGNVSLDYSFPRSYPTVSRIRDVDFRNLSFRIFDRDGDVIERIPLKDGKRNWTSDGLHNQITLEDVYYLTPANSSGLEYALLTFYWFSAGGSSSTQGYAQVFELRNHRLRIVQQFDWDEHFQTKEYYLFDPPQMTLTVRSAHYLPGDAHCCVFAMDVFTLRWTGAAFEQVRMQTELSDYGKQAGKALVQPR